MAGAEIVFGQSVFEWLSSYGYYIFPLLVIPLGPVALFASGVFSSLGPLNPFIFFVISLLTTTTTDGLLFALGKFGRRFLNKFKRSRTIVEKIDLAESGPDRTWVNVIKDNYGKLFFFLKVSPTVALTDILAVVGGLLKVEFRRHYIASIFGQMIWSSTFIALGFYIGGAVQDVRFLINTTGIILGSLLILMLLYEKFIHHKAMDKFGNTIIFLKSIFSKNDNNNSNKTERSSTETTL